VRSISSSNSARRRRLPASADPQRAIGSLGTGPTQYAESPMAHQSEPEFRAFHALRIKGFAKADMVADIADISVGEAETYLKALLDREHAMFREARSLWQITPAGKEAHRAALAADAPANVVAALHGTYETFLGINTAFKELCGDWQLRDGQPNDHSDAAYDKAIIERLVAMKDEAEHVHGCHVRFVPRRVDGTSRRPHSRAGHRSLGGREFLMARFGQVITAMVTPFDAAGRLDLDGARRLARWLQDNGNDGLVIAGTTGEAPVLTDDERLSLFAAVIEAVTIPVIAGSGTNDTAFSRCARTTTVRRRRASRLTSARCARRRRCRW